MMIADGQRARLEGDSRAGLAEACRRIMDELASSTAETQAFAQASELVQQAVGILAGADHGRSMQGVSVLGPPGCVHGGFIAAAFDEVLGLAQGMSGRPGMTARLTVQYRSPSPLLQALHFVGDIDHVDGRKIFTKGELRVAADGRLCAEAEGLFISMNPEIFQRLMNDRAGS